MPKYSIAQKIWSLLTASEQRSAVMLVGLMVIGMILETLSIGLVVPTIAMLTQADISRNFPKLQSILQLLGSHGELNFVMVGVLALVIVYLFRTIFLAFLVWRQTHFAYGLQAQLSQRLFSLYLRQPYTFHLQRNSAQLIRNAISEVGVFTANAILPGMLLLSESLVLIGLCSLLLYIEPLGTLIVVIVLGSAAWGFHRFTQSRITRWGEARLHHETMRLQHLQEGLGGAKDVKLLGREDGFLDQYSVHNLQSARAGQLQLTLSQLPRLWLELLAVSGLALLVASLLAQNRTHDTIFPILGLFAAAAFRLMPSINRVLGAVQLLRYGMPVINTLSTEFKLAITEANDTNRSVTPFKERIELNSVTYTYPGVTEPSLIDISLTIQRGESIGFIGASGGGKSTLVDILLGLLAPEKGEVRVDGVNIQNNLRNWQDQIGYVPQSIFLTDDTLRRNVAFGLPEEQINDFSVQRAIQTAQLEEFVESLPNGLETIVGERGVRLSGGQRQRIGIARSIYHDPAVLVLDEATSSLDSETEQSVMQAIKALMGSKTIIIIAHRLSTVEHCNQLFRLERGRIALQGTPHEIIHSRKIHKS